MKLRLKFLAFVLSCMLIAGTCMGCVKYAMVEDTTISYLYVTVPPGGYGTEWMENIAERFEELHKESSYKDGKKGVDIVVQPTEESKDGTQLRSNIANSAYQLFVVEGLNFASLAATGALYDIDAWAKEDLADGSGTIESKFYDDQKAALKAIDDKYYALPVYAGFNGLTYDADLFEHYKLYFADENGVKINNMSSYTNSEYTGRGFVNLSTDKKSPGPDGIYGTYDDGLPSSYEEFFYLLDAMTEMTIIPLIWTGKSTHYTDYLTQSLLTATSSKTSFSANFSFNSGSEKLKIVTGFNGDEPIIEEYAVNDDNGYLVSQQYEKYKVMKFLFKLYSNEKYYDPSCKTTNISNTQAQKMFEESSLDSKSTPIAMLIEGNYWYNEARPELEESVTRYKDAAKNRNFRIMPLPSEEFGTVNVNEGRKIMVSDAMYYYMIVNATVKNDPEKEKLAKDFVQFFYQTANIQSANVDTGIPLALKYELTQEQYNSMDNFPQSLWDVYEDAKKADRYMTPFSTNPIFINNTVQFDFRTSRFSSSVANFAFTAVRNNISLVDYFKGMAISEAQWNTTYNIYN